MKFELADPEEVEEVICVLDPCPSHLVNVSLVVACGWMQVMVDASLQEEMISLNFEEAILGLD